MDPITQMQRVVAETARLVDGTTPQQLDQQTPCADWKVRDLLNHITNGATMFASAAEHGSVPDEVMAKLGDDHSANYQADFHAAADGAVKAYAAPGVLDKQINLPFGEMPGAVVLNLAAFDLFTHAADLAHATGQEITDTEMAETALAIGQQMIGPDMRKPGFFSEAQPVADDAPAARRLLAFAGRAV